MNQHCQQDERLIQTDDAPRCAKQLIQNDCSENYLLLIMISLYWEKKKYIYCILKQVHIPKAQKINIQQETESTTEAPIFYELATYTCRPPQFRGNASCCCSWYLLETAPSVRPYINTHCLCLCLCPSFYNVSENQILLLRDVVVAYWMKLQWVGMNSWLSRPPNFSIYMNFFGLAAPRPTQTAFLCLAKKTYSSITCDGQVQSHGSSHGLKFREIHQRNTHLSRGRCWYFGGLLIIRKSLLKTNQDAQNNIHIKAIYSYYFKDFFSHFWVQSK